MRRRSNARLAAVQALYQMETSGAGVDAVVAEFRSHWIGAEIDGAPYGDADAGFFEDLIRGVVRLQTKIDPAIELRLASKWTLPRLDATARAILRSAAYELIQHSSTPAFVIVDEYMEVANSFFEGAEPRFINAALDGMARDLRTEEIAAAAGARRS